MRALRLRPPSSLPSTLSISRLGIHQNVRSQVERVVQKQCKFIASHHVPYSSFSTSTLLRSTDASPTRSEKKVIGSRPLQTIVINDNGAREEKTFTRADLLHEVKLQQRDLRLVDISFPTPVPSLLVKENAIAVNMMHIKAIIQHNRLLIFDPHNPSVKHFLQRIELDPSLDPSSPFEFRAFEALLIEILGSLETQLQILKPDIQQQLDNLTIHPEPDSSSAGQLLILRHRLNRLGNSVKGVFTELQELWQSDEDMSSMYLTFHSITGRKQSLEKHDEIEGILETYLRNVELLKTEIHHLQRSVSVTDEFVDLHLDSIRNKIMRMNLLLTVGTFSTALSSMVAAIFGMNLTSTLESHPQAFFVVTGGIVTGNAVVFAGAYLWGRHKRIWK